MPAPPAAAPDYCRALLYAGRFLDALNALSDHGALWRLSPKQADRLLDVLLELREGIDAAGPTLSGVSRRPARPAHQRQTAARRH